MLPVMVPATFHPAVAAWFRSAFPATASVQLNAWAIGASANTLISAPTGSGKTLAFIAMIDELAKQAAQRAPR